MHPSRTRGFWLGCTVSLAFAATAGILWQSVLAPTPAYAQSAGLNAYERQVIEELEKSNKQLKQVVNLLTELRDFEKKTTTVPPSPPDKPKR